MKCPYCGDLDTRVVDSRLSQGGEVTRRRRECGQCARRYTTYERVEEILSVVKSDGRREPFDRARLSDDLRRACRKRPVSCEQIETIVIAIERELAEAEGREVTTMHVGERAMASLRDVDEIAYVRFLSTHRPFRNLQDFADQIGTLVRTRAERGRG